MRIAKLRLTGFKSFVEPAELRIEPGLTGVVGPNGCGKSNLLEAIRWVMGEGSPKSLRGGGMEDVIFAGTATRPARDFAEVAILVERPDGDGNGAGELEVVRRIERGAGSAYRMDGRDVRQRDVALVFADAATGAHSPALVSQNRIGAIIAARPPERRQMLEEAAGIAGLHVRRKEAETRLRATEANLARLDELLGDMIARAATLRRQARAAGRYRALSDAIRAAEARLIWARWRDAAAAADAAQAEAAAAEGAVIAAAEAQRAAAAHQAEAARLLARAHDAAAEARAASAAARQHRAGLHSAREAAVRRLGELATQRDAIARDRLREDLLARDAADARARLAAEAAALAAALVAAEEERVALAAGLGEAERAAGGAEAALGAAVAAEAAAQAERRVADAAAANARARLARAEAEAARVTREAATLADPAPLAAEQAAATLRAERAAEAIAGAQAALGESEAARAQAAAARDVAESRGAEARAVLAALEAEARALAGAAARGGGDRALAHVRAAPGYERALAAALGDDLEASLGAQPILGARAWTGAEVRADDPPLAPGLAPLAGHVTAPAALARRLRQVGVVPVDDGVVLAVGQRLVTLDGRMRRWDGFVAHGGGAAAAEALIRANRLAAIDDALPSARAGLAEARAAAIAAADALAAAAARGAAARAALGEAEGVRRTALRAADAAAGARERLAYQRTAIEERVARAAAERDEAGATARMAEAARAALPEGDASAGEVARLRGIAMATQTALAEARARAAALVATIARDRGREAAARAEAEGWIARAHDAERRIGEIGARAAAIAGELARLADTPASLDAALAEADVALIAADGAATAARDAEAAAAARGQAAEAQAEQARETLSAAREARAGAVARGEHHALRRVELGRLAGERFGCPAPVLPRQAGFASDGVGAAEAEAQAHDRLAAERERLGPVNLVAERELADLEAQHGASQAERHELASAVAGLRGSIGSLNREGRARLLAAFETVDGHFRRLFGTLFEGGEAHLALVDSDDPLEAGLEIMAQPPGKRLGSLTLLSGGEQALTAVALIFALFLTNPAPICVLDEVDAPLDDANIERFCDLLDAMTRETETRYLIVTHNAVTMSRMHRLFGVTMIERGVSRLVSVDLGGAEALLAAE